MTFRQPDALTVCVRIREKATGIVNASNIVTPPQETGGKREKECLT